MAATSIASRSSLGSILRTASRRSLISPRPRISSVPNPNPNSSSPPSPLRQTRIEASSLPRFVRREVSTHQPFHSVVAAACLVSKLPSDLTSFEDTKPKEQLLYFYFLFSNLVKKLENRQSRI